MGHPRDVCHAVSDGGDCPDGVVGDGSWDRDTYFRVNHGFATTAAWQAATGMTNPTRYEVYRWELSSGSLGTRAVGSLYSSKAPICSHSGGASSEERSVGTECVDERSTRRSPYLRKINSQYTSSSRLKVSP